MYQKKNANNGLLKRRLAKEGDQPPGLARQHVARHQGDPRQELRLGLEEEIGERLAGDQPFGDVRHGEAAETALQVVEYFHGLPA